MPTEGTERVIDTHAHLQDPAFAEDLPATLRRAQAAGVTAVVCAGYDGPSSRQAVALAHQYPQIWAAVGIHPNDVASASDGDFLEVAELARDPRVVGIGETGLDYYRNRTPVERQREALEWHLHLAEELKLPLIVHNREADSEIARMLESVSPRPRDSRVPGVLHSFSSTDPGFLDRMLAAGYFVSFGGLLTFKRNDGLRQAAACVPVDRVVVETDSPYLAPEPVRGRRDEPAFVCHVSQRLAEVRHVAYLELARQLWANTQHLFPALARHEVEAA